MYRDIWVALETIDDGARQVSSVVGAFESVADANKFRESSLTKRRGGISFFFTSLKLSDEREGEYEEDRDSLSSS